MPNIKIEEKSKIATTEYKISIVLENGKELIEYVYDKKDITSKIVDMAKELKL